MYKIPNAISVQRDVENASIQTTVYHVNLVSIYFWVPALRLVQKEPSLWLQLDFVLPAIEHAKAARSLQLTVVHAQMVLFLTVTNVFKTVQLDFTIQVPTVLPVLLHVQAVPNHQQFAQIVSLASSYLMAHALQDAQLLWQMEYATIAPKEHF